jgi:predicted O-methyltransferase YrrM
MKTQDLKRYPKKLTKFKTNNYIPGEHYRNDREWDHFTMHVPVWTQVLNKFFKGKKNLKFLELGTGNGLCSNFLLDTYDCNVDTVDLQNIRNVKVFEEEYSVISTENLKPFIDSGRCKFHQMSTKDFLLNNRDKVYDFIYVDASHICDDVLTDAILSFDLLKKDGLMIFDDYYQDSCKIGINSFINCFVEKIKLLHTVPAPQIMLKKINE